MNTDPTVTTERPFHGAKEMPYIGAADLLALGRACGADDCGLVSVDDPLVGTEKPYIMRAFPGGRTILVIISRMNVEPVHSPARSIANLEFHEAGDHTNEIARRIVRALEDRGIRALNPAMAFPMEMEEFPERGWIISQKVVAEAAGLGRMGIHRSVIHPKFGSFILIGSVVIAATTDSAAQPLDYNPCLSCKLCVAACPVGAIRPDGYFDFSACFNHNYQQFMGGFVNFVEDIAESRDAADFRTRSGYSETITRWQSLAYGPNYNAANCIAVCPAGSDVIGPYLENAANHKKEVLDPLTARSEPVYVVKNSDAESYVSKRFPHKRIRHVRTSARLLTIKSFLWGMPLGFQREKSKGLTATYHFTFTGKEPAVATVVIKDRTLSVLQGHAGKPDLRITADSTLWLRFLAKEVSLPRLLLTGSLRLKGSPRLLAAFGRCFPS